MIKSIKKNLAVAALAIAAVMVPATNAFAFYVQCGPGGAALIYYYNSDGSVNKTVWVSQHAMCV